MVITDTPDQTDVRYVFNLSPAFCGHQGGLPIIHHPSEHSLGFLSVERSAAAYNKHKRATDTAIHSWRSKIEPIEGRMVDGRTAKILDTVTSCREGSRNLREHLDFIAR